MLSHELYLLVTCITALSSAIRVDWNTNKGPIVPPTPRTTIHPQPPYREPAPVWEAQSNDIPNPNTYVYVLPPPSRPRPATNNYLTSDRRPVTQENYNLYNNNNYGSIVPPNAAPAYVQHSGNSNAVASLSTKYVPNVGNKYYAVVPGKGYTAFPSTKPNVYYFSGDKLQGKYNAKTKKYKAYEKVKYVPQSPSYLPVFQFELPAEQQPEIFNQQQLLETQQLPVPLKPQPFAAVTQQQQQPTPTPQPKLNYLKDVSEKSLAKVKRSEKSTPTPNAIHNNGNNSSSKKHS